MSNLEHAVRLALDAMEAALDESVYDNHFSCRAILAAQIVALRAAKQQSADDSVRSAAEMVISAWDCANCSRDAEAQAHAADIVNKWRVEKEQAEPVALTDKAINAAITAWFGDYKFDYFNNDEFLDRMRAAIKAAQDFKEAT
jgi:phosphoheptose isomerase